MAMNQQETFNWMCAELDRLRAELATARQDAERLRAALEKIALNCDPNDLPWADPETGRRETGDIARAALQGAADAKSR